MNTAAQTLKLLAVEDSARDARILAELLRHGGTPVALGHVRTLESAIQALAADNFDCILLDLGLPDGDGIENVQRVRKACRDSAIVVLTGRDDDNAALEALRHGAQEYAVKGEHDGEDLLRIIKHAIERHRMVNELDGQREREYHRASHDVLTGLPNRQLFMDRAQVALKQAERQTSRFALCFMDLDGFKQVNDQHGHAVGDVLLKEVAGALRETVRSSDTVARVGGDEFVILLTPANSQEEVENTGRRLIERVRSIASVSGKPIRIGASAGLALYPEHGTSLDQLVVNADRAMYEAKRAGKGTLRVHGLRPQADRNSPVLDNLVLHYQPWLGSDGRFGGIEALIRPSRGENSVKEMLSRADSEQLLDDLGRMVLTRACKEWLLLEQQKLAPPRLAVNVAAAELRAHHFASSRLAILQATDFPSARLQLEIAEHVMENADVAMLGRIEALRAAGAKILVDNCGREPVSLRKLAQMPVDGFKLDISLMIAMRSGDISGRAIAAGLVAFARTLGREIIYTGVESDADRRACVHADGIQGYWLSHPLPADALPALLSQAPRGLSAA